MFNLMSIVVFIRPSIVIGLHYDNDGKRVLLARSKSHCPGIFSSRGHTGYGRPEQEVAAAAR